MCSEYDGGRIDVVECGKWLGGRGEIRVGVLAGRGEPSTIGVVLCDIED